MLNLKALKKTNIKMGKGSFVESLKRKHAGRSIHKVETNDFNTDVLLFQKWAYRVKKGWYGFSLSPAPNSWAFIIDDFLVWLEKQDPSFKILQAKVKFGRLRFYTSHSGFLSPDKGENIRLEIRELCEWLYSESLVY